MIKDEAMGMRFIGKAMILTALSCALTTAFVGCDNALAAGAAALQAKAVSPVISVKLADSSALNSGGSLSFGTISVGASSDITLTIANTGVNSLSLDLAGIKVTPDSSTAASVFSVSTAPSATIDSSTSSSIVIRFVPDSEGAKGATISIPTNDLSCPSFSISLSGKGWAVALTTAAISSISYTTASSGGNITNDGGEDIIERGICWSTTLNPTIGDRKKSDAGVGTGSYTCAISGLLPGTYYYVRAYARTSLTTGYGPTVGFTSSDPTPPTTATVTAINATSATSGCTAVADTGVTLQECGICWSTSANPTTAENHVSGTSGASISISGLSLATTYYVRAYAILKSGEATKTIYANSDLSMKTVGYIGPSGGYVFYDAGVIIAGGARGDWRYLEAAPSDLGTYTWESGTPASASTNTGIGTGYQNTWDLCTAGGTNYPAAAYSFNATYTFNATNYDDFFLPSKDELYLLMLNLANNSLGNISNGRYWSSSASGTSMAYYRINASLDGTYVKTSSYLVRPIRRY